MRTRIIIVLYALSLGLLHVDAQTTDEWPMFRGDPQLRGLSQARLEVPLVLKWTYEASDDIMAAPVIGGQTIFISSIDGMVYALDMKGNLKWKLQTNNSIEAPALYLEGKVYVGNLGGRFHAIDARTGRTLWTYETGFDIMGSANYYKKGQKTYLLIGSYDYFLHCLDAESGSLVWKYESNNYVNAAAAIGQGMALFGGCDGYLHMVDLADGSLVDKVEVATYIAGSAALDEELTFTGDYDGFITCIDIQEKKIKWEFDAPDRDLPILGSPSVSGNRLLIGGQDKHMRCLDKRNGDQLWAFNAGGRIDASPVIVKNMVITATKDGMLYILDLETGKELWSYEIGSYISQNPAVINDCVIVGAGDGNVYCFQK